MKRNIYIFIFLIITVNFIFSIKYEFNNTTFEPPDYKLSHFNFSGPVKKVLLQKAEISNKYGTWLESSMKIEAILFFNEIGLLEKHFEYYNEVLSIYCEYNYNKNNLLTDRKIFNNSGVIKQICNYKYNDKQEITEINVYNSSNILTKKILFDEEKNNITTKMEFFEKKVYRTEHYYNENSKLIKIIAYDEFDKIYLINEFEYQSTDKIDKVVCKVYEESNDYENKELEYVRYLRYTYNKGDQIIAEYDSSVTNGDFRSSVIYDNYNITKRFIEKEKKYNESSIYEPFMAWYYYFEYFESDNK